MLQITNLTKKQVPKNIWRKIFIETLGGKYDLSVVFAGNALMKKLNARYRRKNKTASVLSFPISGKEAPLRQGFAGQGEIFINTAQKKHPPLFLFIHALLHLKGFKHSAKMEEQEKKLMKKYGSPQYSNRH